MDFKIKNDLRCFFQVLSDIVRKALSSLWRGMSLIDQDCFHSALPAAENIGVLVANHPGKSHIQMIFFFSSS